jgi:UDP-perosamine 4-acetyltransferase
MVDVVIVGAGGLGRVVRDVLAQSGRYRPVAFLDSDPAKKGLQIDGLTVLGDLSCAAELCQRGVRHAVVAIGDNRTRVRIAQELESSGMRLASAIHPLASVALTASIGPHVVIGPRATICVHARVNAHAVICAGAIVEHDNVIGAGAFLYPAARLAGGVTVEELATIGIGACVIPYRRVGRGALVRPGAVVISDVPAGAVASGVPARVEKPVPSRFVPGVPVAIAAELVAQR